MGPTQPPVTIGTSSCIPLLLPCPSYGTLRGDVWLYEQGSQTMEFVALFRVSRKVGEHLICLL
jgi:hypothetical protein